jgi:hypothetical protein
MTTTVEPTPAILDLNQALEGFRTTVTPLLNPAQEEDWDGVKLKEKEWAILLAGLRLVGHCIAILIHRLALTESVKLAANVRSLGKAGLHYTSEGLREVPVTLIGGIRVRIPVLYKLAREPRNRLGRKRKRGKRGKSRGQGFYPVLTLLGISEGVSPLVRCLVSQAATQASSFEQAKQFVTWLGLGFGTGRIRRISEAFAHLGLAIRDEQLARLAEGTLPAGEALKGKRVVISVDGGRVKIRRTYRRGRKRKSGWPGYETNWREPKLLTIYVLDEQGHKVNTLEVPLVADGTLGGKDEFLKILHLHLHKLGIAQAEIVVLVGDGAPWIWNNIPPLLRELGCRPEQIVQVLDYPHAVEHIYQLAEALFGDTAKGKAWAEKWAKKFKKGQAQNLVAEIQRYLVDKVGEDLDTVRIQYGYFQNHQTNGRLDYARFKAQKLPVGSGVVESLIRQVVNLRLKSSGKNWLEENAEAFVHARCQWAAHQWSDFCNAVLTSGLAPPT